MVVAVFVVIRIGLSRNRGVLPFPMLISFERRPAGTNNHLKPKTLDHEEGVLINRKDQKKSKKHRTESRGGITYIMLHFGLSHLHSYSFPVPLMWCTNIAASRTASTSRSLSSTSCPAGSSPNRLSTVGLFWCRPWASRL